MNKRWRGLIACVMVLALPATSFAAGAGGTMWQLRPPMTLVAAAGDSLTEPFQINGAKEVVFYLRSAVAESDSLAAVDVLLSTNGVTYIPIGQPGMSGAVKVGAGTGLLQKSGKFVIVSASSNATTSGLVPYVPWAWAKLSLRTNGAQIDSLSVDGWWWDDAGTPGDRRGIQPTVR